MPGSLDFLATTIAQYPVNQYRNLLTMRSYAFRNFMDRAKPRDMTGTEHRFNAIITGDAGDSDTDARSSGFGRTDGGFDTVPIKQQNYMAQGVVPWTQYVFDWALSERDIQLNAGKEGYIDLAKSTPEGAMTRAANVVEREFWSTTAYTAMNTDRPGILGPEYWITDDGYAIDDAGGTLGHTVAGINPTLAAYNDKDGINRWRNQFKQISTANEIIDGMDYLFVKCRFVAPPSVSVNTNPDQGTNSIVFSTTGFLAYKKIMRRLNEPFSEQNPNFNGVKLEFADGMTARTDGTEQAFFFNNSTWKSAVAAKKNWTKDPVFTPNNQPNVRAQYMHYWPALWCEDRRSNGKLFGFSGRLAE